MLAGLSQWGILSMPPDFCATADAEIKMSASAAHTATRPHAICFPYEPHHRFSRRTRFSLQLVVFKDYDGGGFVG
jgi:hypothetical protein